MNISLRSFQDSAEFGIIVNDEPALFKPEDLRMPISRDWNMDINNAKESQIFST